MSVHLYTLSVAAELYRRLDVAGLEQVRQAQLDYNGDKLAAEAQRPWRRKRALRGAEQRFRDAVAAASSRKDRSDA